MIPPIARRCPECGTGDWSSRFRVLTDDGGRRLVECPSCGHRFEPPDNPLRN